jgi:hypothetical protein
MNIESPGEGLGTPTTIPERGRWKRRGEVEGWESEEGVEGRLNTEVWGWR